MQIIPLKYFSFYFFIRSDGAKLVFYMFDDKIGSVVYFILTYVAITTRLSVCLMASLQASLFCALPLQLVTPSEVRGSSTWSFQRIRGHRRASNNCLGGASSSIRTTWPSQRMDINTLICCLDRAPFGKLLHFVQNVHSIFIQNLNLKIASS